MGLLTGRHYSARSVFRSSLGRSPPSKFGCGESALVLTTEPQWDCRETASVLLTDRPSDCGQAVAELLSVERLHSISLGAHRCLSRNIEGMTATEGRGRIDFPAENNLLSFDRGRAIRLLRSRIGVARREPTQLFPQCDRSAFAWTRSSDPTPDKLHWYCSPAVNSVPEPPVLLRPNCCRTAFRGETSFNQPRCSSLFVAQYRRNDRNGGVGSNRFSC